MASSIVGFFCTDRDAVKTASRIAGFFFTDGGGRTARAHFRERFGSSAYRICVQGAKRCSVSRLLTLAALLSYAIVGRIRSVGSLEPAARPPASPQPVSMLSVSDGLSVLRSLFSSPGEDLPVRRVAHYGLLEIRTGPDSGTASDQGHLTAPGFTSPPSSVGTVTRRLAGGGSDPNRTGARPKTPGVARLMQRLSLRRSRRRGSPPGVEEEGAFERGTAGGPESAPNEEANRPRGRLPSSSGRKPDGALPPAAADFPPQPKQGGSKLKKLLMPRRRGAQLSVPGRGSSSTGEASGSASFSFFVEETTPFRASGPASTIPSDEAVEDFLRQQRRGPELFGTSPPESVLVPPCLECDLREQLVIGLAKEEELRRQTEETARTTLSSLEREKMQLEAVPGDRRSAFDERMMTHLRARLWSARQTIDQQRQNRDEHRKRRQQLHEHARGLQKASRNEEERLRGRLRRAQRDRDQHSADWVQRTRQSIVAAGMRSSPPASGRESPSRMGAAGPAPQDERPGSRDRHAAALAVNAVALTTVRRNRQPS